MKFTVAHYKRPNSNGFINGGRFIRTDNKYILKCFFKTVAVFEMDKIKVQKIPDEWFYKGISVSDGKQEYYLYFFKSTAEKIYKTFNIC